MNSSFGNWFGKSKKQVSQPQPGQKPPAAPKPTLEADYQPGVLYKEGNSLAGLGCNEEAIHCYDQVLELDPHYVVTWYNKALTEEKFGRRQDTARSYRQFLTFASTQKQKKPTRNLSSWLY